MLAAVLLVGLPIVIVTGLLSYIAYGPQFGQAFPGDVAWFRLPFFDWPTRPSWLYRLSQGLHVGLGLALIPVVLAKLWSVVPKFFAWPPVRSPAQALERLSLVALVGGLLFEIVTGTMNIQYDYAWGFDFYTAHYWGAWVFIAGFVVHVAIKLPTMVRSLRGGSLRRYLAQSAAETEPEPPDDHGLVAVAPSPPTTSRRTLLGAVAGGSALLGLTALATTVDALRPLAVLSPRGQSYGDGPNDFQVNRTASGAGIPPTIGEGWTLRLTGGAAPVTLTRDQLLAMPPHTATLPIACVEGWSTTQTWTGVRLRDLAALAGVPEPATAFVQSAERAGPFARVTLTRGQVLDPDALLALRVNGADLSLDHGFPARVIVPALPGVHNTKWVAAVDFRVA
ncbi:molybdopterin-dependent oxidoreductase [Actinomycetospora straminea]|uniref:Molybdopterin-dependent oxidoreductase n=1 Tax=Actinomycetospora straminea TaxID=663607 RepID=A0ABP9FAE1_9PSEU|nr:molybdopterin-dependent oxidoreductase [Actinomycetospora straminea]MDD7936721.1 molybdopterin-dependent oxidoreductase [Actinomycetospora straminea]